MESLSDFLRKRIDEDEATAKRAAFGPGGAWSAEHDPEDDWASVYAGAQYLFGSEDVDLTDHVARLDPARVLRECEAKRRMLVDTGAWVASGNPVLAMCAEFALGNIASAYAGHPDYDPSWAL